MTQKTEALINDLKVRRAVLIPEDISHSGRVEFAHFRLDHIDAVLDEVERLTAERERYKAALENIAARHPNAGLLIQSGNIAREALAEAVRP